MGNIFRRDVSKYNKLEFLEDGDYSVLDGESNLEYKNADNLGSYNYQNIVHNLEKYIKDINCKLKMNNEDILKN